MAFTGQLQNVPSQLRELKIKIGAFTRCFYEYGTYLKELEKDEELLKQLEAENRETKQQKLVIKETMNMIPLARQRCCRMAEQLVTFWESQRGPLETGIRAGPFEDQAKWKKDLAFHHTTLSKTLAIETEKNPLVGEPAGERVKEFHASLGQLSAF